MHDSSFVETPLIVVNGAEPGPILWIDSTMHGTEILGFEIIRRLVREEINPATLKGALITAPIVNPLAYYDQVMNTLQDENNMNRVFPGNAGGLITQRLAHQMFQDGVLKADYAITFHASPKPAVEFSIVSEDDDPISVRSQEMADAFGVTTLWLKFKNEPRRNGTLPSAAGARGKPVLLVELVGWREFDPVSIEIGLRGTMNIMRRLGMIEGEIEPQSSAVIIPGPLTRHDVVANKGGFAYPTKKAGEAVAAGEPILLLRNPYGDIVEEIASPADGWLLAYHLRNNYAAMTGDMVAFVASTHGGAVR
jgi:predicted deacylase